MIRNHSLFWVGLLLFVQFSVQAQVDTIPAERLKALAQDDSIPAKPLSSIPKNERTPSVVPDLGYFKSWITDAKDLVISPYRWNKYQWIAVSGVLVLTAVFVTQDASIQKIVQKNQNRFMDNLSKFGLERLGSGMYSLPALGIMYVTGTLVKNDQARYTALKGFEAYLLGTLADNLMKQISQRHRPNKDNPANPYIWDGPFNKSINSSFPSGHSTNIFAIATVVATSYSKTVWVPIVCYTLAGLGAASRVYQNDHWFSDVFLGSALGFAIGRTIMNNHIKKVKVLPISHVGSGVMLVYEF